MQIDVDFEVYKSLTFLRRSEEDSYNDVLRRLLAISESTPAIGDLKDKLGREPINVLGRLLSSVPDTGPGTWMGNVFLPDGTKFRATYKGRLFRAEIQNQAWVDEDGVHRQSPSEAAGAISGTNVNGWRFWFAMRPGDDQWYRLDDLRK